MNYERIGDPETHTRIQQYELAFRMQSSVPELTDLATETGGDVSTVRRGSSQARHVCQYGSAGPADGRTRRSVRADLSQQLGHARQRRRSSARSVPRRRSSMLRSDPGSETTRLVGRDADHLGRRVRPHDLLAGQAVQGELRPRPSPALLHDVDGRRRRRREARSTAKPTTSPTTSSEIPSTSATSTPPCCICWATTTSDSSSSIRASTSG